MRRLKELNHRCGSKQNRGGTWLSHRIGLGCYRSSGTHPEALALGFLSRFLGRSGRSAASAAVGVKRLAAAVVLQLLVF